MIDNIFQIETVAVAQRACTTQDNGILFTGFAIAYPSVDHQWIMAGLQRAGSLQPLLSFLGALYTVNFTKVEYNMSENDFRSDGVQCKKFLKFNKSVTILLL